MTNARQQFQEYYQAIHATELLTPREKMFIGCGLASTLVGLIALSLLLFDLASEGLPRLTWDFFTSFPSRRASAAWHSLQLKG